MERGLEVLRAWGYEPVFGRHLRGAHRYLAGTDDERLLDVQWALSSGSVEAVWAVRGGFGLTRILDRIDWESVENPVIGFSDLTALLVASWQRRGISGVHGPVLHNLAEVDDASRGRLRAVLSGEETERQLGGNLCVLADLCGTPDQLVASGGSLLVEDLAEPAYKIDRMLTRLARSGALDGVTELRVGRFLNCKAPEGVAIPEVIRDSVPARIPIVEGFAVGHGEENHAFRFGR